MTLFIDLESSHKASSNTIVSNTWVYIQKIKKTTSKVNWNSNQTIVIPNLLQIKEDEEKNQFLDES